ncbi:MAG: GcrA family cell cycle regulator [Parvibaculaceae bacterium]|nr:GcrA family cell cycle regulator [Parvibaculaceae bacterium]
MRGTVTRWEDAEDIRLEELIAGGYSFTMIARELKRSRNSCIGRAHRLGLSCPKDAPRKPDPEKSVKPDYSNRPPRPKRLNKTVTRVEEPVFVDQPFEGEHGLGVPDAVLSLQFGQCKWPVGEVEDPNFHFCQKNIAPDSSSYCHEHRQKAFQSPRSRTFEDRLAWAKNNPKMPGALNILREAAKRGMAA